MYDSLRVNIRFVVHCSTEWRKKSIVTRQLTLISDVRWCRTLTDRLQTWKMHFTLSNNLSQLAEVLALALLIVCIAVLDPVCGRDAILQSEMQRISVNDAFVV
jgi:hypothetical protein